MGVDVKEASRGQLRQIVESQSEVFWTGSETEEVSETLDLVVEMIRKGSCVCGQ